MWQSCAEPTKNRSVSSNCVPRRSSPTTATEPVLDSILRDTALFALAKAPFDAQCEKLQSLENQGVETLEHAFTFMERAFLDGQEMVVFVTELTITPEIAVFLSEHRIERYETYKDQLLIGTKRAEILAEIARD